MHVYIAKTVNRLSSDTDNETDRLLGTQRNDQLQKITNNELVSNNNSTVDPQTTNNFIGKQTSNSKEGKKCAFIKLDSYYLTLALEYLS